MNNYELRLLYGTDKTHGNHIAWYPSKGKAMVSAYGNSRGHRNTYDALYKKFTVWNTKTGKCVGGYEIINKEYSLQTPDYKTGIRLECTEIKPDMIPKWNINDFLSE